jgi:shikimate kinase
MGAGKSTTGLRLARELGWSFIDLDEEIVRAEKNSIAAIFENSGEATFRELERLALAEALRRSNIVLALGGGAIETASNRKLLADTVQTLLIYLEAPLDVLLARCGEQSMLNPEAARRPILEKQPDLAARFLKRQPLYASAHWTIETAERSPDEIVGAILARLEN